MIFIFNGCVFIYLINLFYYCSKINPYIRGNVMINSLSSKHPICRAAKFTLKFSWLSYKLIKLNNYLNIKS